LNTGEEKARQFFSSGLHDEKAFSSFIGDGGMIIAHKKSIYTL
jgi:hypothetical protein